ncbi:hypothetical protein GJAV_G00028870 [Gymnothorax javanicus]|nr:hypothetical protein GJAV_G00028870 [Gymnothorax javanicus]
MRSAAEGLRVSESFDPTNGKDRALMVAQAAMHTQHGLSRRVRYREKYHCNRGGQLQDKKKRQLVKRLFCLWIRKTFGRAHPSQARAHYQQKILRVALGVWKEEWWLTRVEWRLCMRAECHYRYRLYNWVFINWRQFVAMQRKNKERFQMAASHAERRCQRLTWENWLAYLKMQRNKQNMQVAAQKQRQNSILRSAWMLWIGCFQVQKRLHIFEECALQHWALSLQSKAWLQWRGVYLLACSLRKEENRAAVHHSHGLQRKAMFAWTNYCHYRQAKKEQNVSSKHAQHFMVLRRCLRTWRDKFLDRQSEKAKWHAASALAQQHAQLRALHHWKGYTNQCLEVAERNRFACEHYKCQLMRMGLRLLSLNVSQRKAHQINKNIAHQQHRQKVIVKYWHCWQERYEESEERNYQQQRDTALTHHKVTLLNNALHCWRNHLTELRIGKEMELQASCFYARQALPLFFNSWKEYIAQKKKTREMMRTAEAYFRQCKCTWVFCTWLTQSEERRDRRLAERLAVLHADRSILLRAFVHWQARADWEREERGKTEASERLYMRTLLLNTLCLWRDNIALMQSGREKEQQAMRHHCVLCARKALTGWRKYVQHRREKRRSLEKSDNYYQCKLLANMLHHWKEYHHGSQQVNYIAEERQRLHHQNFLRQAFCTWREKVTLLVRDKTREKRAYEQYQRILLTKVLWVWREATAHAIYSHHQQEEEVTVARTYLQGVRLQQVFRYWRKQSQKVRHERLGTEKARQNHQTALLRKCIRAWFLYYRQHQHKKAMVEQAQCLLRWRTCLRHFIFWKRQLEFRYVESEQTDVALWQWSFNLLAKVMEAWRSWVSERHRKRDRLARAAQFHRDQLLREGVTHILSYSADMRRFRVSLALQSQEQTAQRLQGVVWHCAMLWKQRVLGESGGQKGKSHQKSVSLCLPLTIPTPGSSSKDDSVGSALRSGSADDTSGQQFFVCKPRMQPRRPGHLLNSLDKEPLLKSTHNRAEMLPSRPRPANPIQANGLAIPPASELFCLPANVETPLKDPQHNSMHQEVLLPPSSFLTSKVYSQQSASILMAQPGPCCSDMLLSPKKFIVCHGAARTASVCEEDKRMECKLDQQPRCHTSATLAKELQTIQQKMHHFQSEKRQLQCWRKLAEVLKNWLRISGNEDDTEFHSTRQELEELEARIRRLSTWLEEEKPVMQCYIARICSISSSLREDNQ